jgi:hypothetical protein
MQQKSGLMGPPNSALKKENVNLIWDDVQHQQRLGFFRKFPEDELANDCGAWPTAVNSRQIKEDIACSSKAEIKEAKSKKALFPTTPQSRLKIDQGRQPLPNQDSRQIKEGTSSKPQQGLPNSTIR